MWSRNYNPNPPEPEPESDQYNPFDPYASYNSNYNSTGYYAPEYSHYDILTSYIHYFESLGYQFEQDSAGNYHTVSTSSNPYSNYNDPNYYTLNSENPWMRDAGGNIIGVKTDH